MAKPTDITDSVLRDLLVEAEQLVDRKEYNASVEKSMQAYSRLIDQRLDVIVKPGDRRGAAPSFDRVLSAAPPRPWPDVCGVDLVWEEGAKPSLKPTKDRFTISDAVTYMEYTLDMAMRAQKS